MLDTYILCYLFQIMFNEKEIPNDMIFETKHLHICLVHGANGIPLCIFWARPKRVYVYWLRRAAVKGDSTFLN